MSFVVTWHPVHFLRMLFLSRRIVGQEENWEDIHCSEKAMVSGDENRPRLFCSLNSVSGR